MKSKLIFLFLVLMFFSASLNAAINIYTEPRSLPESKIVHQSGLKFSLSDFKGDFVLAHFWSKTCAPCIKELKSLNNFHNKVKDKGVRLILISPQSEWFDANEQNRFLKRFGATDVEFYVEENDNLSADFGIFTTPHTVIIDRKGQEVGRLRGSETWDKDKVVDYILELEEKFK
ncbi:MAG: TlpA family protein disulfide reductase [Alphaproteobacteria bacterium]|nr:TlpA family protein disulfide reductase [Alphaproteobacteria bacterium]